MDKKTYNKTTEAEFIGRKVISLVPFSNGMYRFPAGMTFTIQGKQGGLSLISDPCPHCSIRAHISKVQPGYVDFTDQENLWPSPAVKEF